MALYKAEHGGFPVAVLPGIAFTCSLKKQTGRVNWDAAMLPPFFFLVSRVLDLKKAINS